MLVAFAPSSDAVVSGRIPVLAHVPPEPLSFTGTRTAVVPGASGAGTATPVPALPRFTATAVDGVRTLTYTMVGKDPSIPTAHPLTTVKALLVPIVISFPNGKRWDPTFVDSCDPGTSALTRTRRSPLFASQPWTWGGTSVGTGQVTDAFQRAEFWTYAGPTGVNPTYGVRLALSTAAKVIVDVPAAEAAMGAGVHCGNHLVGIVNTVWLETYLQRTVVPSLAAQGLDASTLPIFLLHNVVGYIGSPADCCVLGFHSAFEPTPGVTQTYAVATYDNTSLFTGTSDISAPTHEVAEWQDDPFGDNPTEAWGHVGQVAGCQSDLEVGDPLSGTTFADPVGGFIYHPQELAFTSWFFHRTPSLGVNGWYSDQGTFTSSAAACS
jgi:hypothetical protein